jgi:hypothetical protein
MGNVKISRLGHRQAEKNGVITIASQIIAGNLFFGVSYCSPKEKTYDKQLGNNLALHDLAIQISKSNYTFFDKEITHSNVISQVLQVILDEEQYPRWAETLLFEGIKYPSGLKRYSKKYNYQVAEPLEIYEIIVNSEHGKEQLLKALKYLHDLTGVDTNFVAVNHLVHTIPDVIVVRD